MQITSAVAAALVLSLAGAAHAELITNGGFETGDFTGWTRWGDLGGTFFTANSHSGNWAAAFGPSSNFGGVRQTLAVGANQTVRLSFWISNVAGPVNALDIKLEGVSLLVLQGRQIFNYTEYTFERTVSSANPVLSFGFYHVPGHFRLDDVSAMVVVPLPSAAIAGVIGLGGVAGIHGIAGHRRRALRR